MPSDADKIRAFDLLASLRAGKGANVTVHHEQAITYSWLGQTDHGIDVLAKSYRGTLLSCLEQAVAAKEVRDAR